MSLNRLADFSGLNRPHLLRVVSGKADATVGWLAVVAETLQVELGELFHPIPAEKTSKSKKKPTKKTLKAV